MVFRTPRMGRSLQARGEKALVTPATSVPT